MSSSQRAKLASGGEAELPLKVSGPGKISLKGTARIDKRSSEVIDASSRAVQAGVVKVPITLSQRGLARLRKSGVLSVQLGAAVADSETATATLKLKTAEARRSAQRRGIAEMRTRAIFGMLLAVTAIFVASAAALPPPRPRPEWTVEMTHSTDPFEGDTFIRGPEPAQANHWDICITNTGDAPTTGPVTFTDVLPPGVKVVGIGYGTFGAGGEPLPPARRSLKSTQAFRSPAP